ncbi:capsule biosynthesis protein [Sphingomonas kaistensis]|uniref:Capsule biosynthesis protein n=1 Tax=Sphingomonas kaistensis TaxID=298708 RepID=A0ABZ2G3X3_9SPHN
MNVNTLHPEELEKALRQTEEPSRRFKLSKRFWQFLVVGLPTLLAALYYGLIASPIYVSQSSFVIKAPGQKAASTLSLANIIQTTGLSSGGEQTREIIAYVRSRNALADLNKQGDLRTLYSERGADFLSRFPRPWQTNSFEDLFKYYGSMVSADIDSESSMAVLQVKAFRPEDAQQINARLLNLSEVLVNRLNERAENRAITEAERRVIQAEDRVRQARVALSAFRNSTSVVDPEKQAQAVLEISNRLTAEQASLQAQLEVMQQSAPDNPAIPVLRDRIAAIGKAIANQNNRVVGNPRAIASRLATFEKLTLEQEFASQVLTAANGSLEQARTEVQKQQYYLERVVEPNLPDDPALPNGFIRVLTVFAASLCLYFIGWMLVVGILEHAPEE